MNVVPRVSLFHWLKLATAKEIPKNWHAGNYDILLKFCCSGAVQVHAKQKCAMRFEWQVDQPNELW